MLRSLFENNPGKGAKKRKRNFWLYSVGEFVLIFLGILIALQVDNWNQKRQEKKLEKVLLSEMLSNLKANQDDIENNIRMQERFLNSNQVALDFLKGDQPWHDSLGIHFTYLMGGTLFDNNNSTYESLNSIGIDLVGNDSLRQQITLVYAVRYPKVEKTQDMLLSYIMDQLYPSLRANLQTVVGREITVPVDLEQLRQNNGFLEDLNMNLFIYNLSIRTYQRALRSTKILIADIEKELGMEPGSSDSNNWVIKIDPI